MKNKVSIVVAIITLVTLLAAFIACDTNESQVIEATRIGSGWARGPADAPVTIDAYFTFT